MAITHNWLFDGDTVDLKAVIANEIMSREQWKVGLLKFVKTLLISTLRGFLS